MRATHCITEVQPYRIILACGLAGPYHATTIPRRVNCLNCCRVMRARKRKSAERKQRLDAFVSRLMALTPAVHSALRLIEMSRPGDPRDGEEFDRVYDILRKAAFGPEEP